MCGRYAFLLPPKAMQDLFKTLDEVLYPPRYNIMPTQPVVAITEQHGRRTAQLFRWGLVPAWVKDPRKFSLLINARAETMAERPAFRDALKASRCIVPASGYFEWKVGPEGGKWPYYITSADDETMAFAGLYSTWSGPDGEEVDTLAIITVAPNLEISSVYDRMPAILRGEAIERWLNTRDVRATEAAALAVSAPAGTMKYHPVGKAIGSRQAEGPELIQPIDLSAEPVEETPKKRKKAAAGDGQGELF